MLAKGNASSRTKQSGIVLVLVSMLMLFILAMAAFAIDINHQILNKARLQNAVDSAALAGAVVADDTLDVTQAETAAIAMLNSFAAASGNSEMTFTSSNSAVTFSADRQSWVNAASFTLPADEDIYVRVAVTEMPLTQYLSYIFSGNKNVSASAVAGRSAAIAYTCNITPIAVCGDPDAGADAVWGYNPDGYNPNTDTDPSLIHELKVGDQDNTDMGPGNFQLLDFSQGTVEDGDGGDTGNGNGNGNGNGGGGDGGGAALVRQALAGAYNGCAAVGATVTTKPGNSIGPVAQGLNTRLNDFSGPMKDDGTVLPDKYVREPNNLMVEGGTYNGDLYYTDYVSELSGCEGGGSCSGNDYISSGQHGRRILRIPIVDCTADSTGKTDFDVLGFGCFFLLQRVENSGQASVFGQFLYDCLINNGSTGNDPTDKGPYRIQLYDDPLSGES
ncbi:TadE/TadG family type IV pilus assembly protein [Vibrio rotiferianus]|uniref:TadE/TadG family type IV pilus assembly protein n=1 Tax=Vibrio rotiferianus TaxID=190895 RepID=UPI0015F53962|nr:TadE/TadG family type IV pilus assembly protein [Vibrio rotiferianus]